MAILHVQIWELLPLNGKVIKMIDATQREQQE